MVKFRNIAEAMGIVTSGITVQEANAEAINAIKKLSADVGIPSGLKELGVRESDFTLMAKNVLLDVCTGGNPRAVTWRTPSKYINQPINYIIKKIF